MAASQVETEQCELLYGCCHFMIMMRWELPTHGIWFPRLPLVIVYHI